MDKDKKIVSIDHNFVYYAAYSFANDFTRTFNCNAIRFINSGTGIIFINDVFQLQPGASLGNEGNQNEIDLTVYRINFAPGFINLLQIWVKTDAGTAYITDKLTSFIKGAKIIDRRTQMLKYGERFKKNANF